jgi:sugar lactone lactonase YvrE
MNNLDCLIAKFVFPVTLGALSLLLTVSPVFSMTFGSGGEEESTPTLMVSAGPMLSPVRVALAARAGHNRGLLVTDYGQNAVFRVNPDDPTDVEKLFSIDGKLLSIAQNGPLLYLGVKDEGVVEVRRHDGRLVKVISTDQPMQPNDLAIDFRKKQLFVADGKAGNIKIFRLTGQLYKTIDGNGELRAPRGIAYDQVTRTIAVSDFGDPLAGVVPSIQLYDFSGNRLLKIAGGFSGPEGLALTARHVLVTDTMLGQILVFDRATGQKVETFGSYGTGENQLLFPMDVSLDEGARKLFVVNNRLGKITVFDYAASEVLQ